MAVASLLLAAAVHGGCTGRASPSSPQIRLNTNTEPSGTVDVTGVPAADLRALAQASFTSDDWKALLRVSVKSSDASGQTVHPPVDGRYAIAQDAIRFTPSFPFDAGRQYDVVFDPSRLPAHNGDSEWRSRRITAVVGLPAVVRTPSTVVTHVYPSGDVVPANQLRLYINFSEPMGLRGGFEHIVLLDDKGNEVVDPFLPLEADFFNDDRTRYTVFFDPGRVKRGILPNKQMGRALEPGRRYTLVVRTAWRDSHGLPLKEEFRREFRVSPADERPLTTSTWKVAAPAAGTRDSLAVTFPTPLDHGLLKRALGVARDGSPLTGEIAIEPGETRWLFTPRDPWREGAYQLVALSFLEDLAGNRIGRAFEVDQFERTDSSPEPERITLPFRVALQTASR